MIFKIASFNMKNCLSKNSKYRFIERLDAIKGFFESEQPDITGTQELNIENIKVLAEALPEYSWLGNGRKGGEKGEYTAIFYRKDKYEVEQYDTFWLSLRPQKAGSRSWLSSYPRTCTWCILKSKIDGSRLRVYNTHLDHISPLARLKGIALILYYAKRYDSDSLSGTVLMGDFNASPASMSLKPINKKGKSNIFNQNSYSVLLTSHNKETRTYHGFKGKIIGKPIDYIFISSGMKINAVLIDQKLYAQRYPSDHYPIIAEIEVKKSDILDTEKGKNLEY